MPCDRCHWTGLLLAALLASAPGLGGEAVPAAPTPPAALTAADSEEPAWKAAIRTKLAKKISFEFVQAPFTETFVFLQQTTGANMVLDPGAPAENLRRGITLRMKEVPASTALDWCLRLAGLDYALIGNAVFISTPDRLGSELRMAVYDVADMLSLEPDHPAPLMTVGTLPEDEAGQGGLPVFALPPPPPPLTGQEIRDMLTSWVSPESWRPGRGSSIEEREGKLLVFQRPEVHREIARFLADLRSTILVSLETSVRFYAVDPAKLADAEKSGRLLGEAAAVSISTQRVHSLRGKTWPATQKRDPAFVGVLLDCQPALSADRSSAALEARIGLWLAAGPENDPTAKVRCFCAPLRVRAGRGQPLAVPLGAIPGEKGATELVVAVLTVRAREPEKLAALNREPPEPDWKGRIRRTLDKDVTLEFVEQPLHECLMYIGGLTDAAIVLDPAVGETLGKRAITLRLTKTRMELALRWLLRMGGLDYELRDGAIFVTRPENLIVNVRQRIYALGDLGAEQAHFRAPLPDDRNRLGDLFGDVDKTHERLGLPYGSAQDMIKRMIEPAGWGLRGTTIQEQNNRLTVHHREEVQKRIAGLLADLPLAVRPEVRVQAAIYGLDASNKARTVAEVERSGLLLSRLATVGDNLQRVFALGGTLTPGVDEDETKFSQFHGAVLDAEPRLGSGHKDLTLRLRLCWAEEDGTSGRTKGSLNLKAGEPAVVELGAAGGRRIAAVLLATVKGATKPEFLRIPGEDAPPFMDAPAAREDRPPVPRPAPFLRPQPQPAPPAAAEDAAIPKPEPDVF